MTNDPIDVPEELIEEKMRQYREEISNTQFTIYSLFTLKNFFRSRGFIAHIMPKITINGNEKTPDFVAIDHTTGQVIIIDHKLFLVKKNCNDVADKLGKIMEYKGHVTYPLRDGTIISSDVEDVAILVSEKSWDNIKHCAKECSQFIIIVYKILEGERVAFEVRTGKHLVKSRGLQLLSSKVEEVEITDEIHLTYFVREDHPLSYILAVMYQQMVSLTGIDPFAEEAKIKLQTLKQRINRHLPPWETTSGYPRLQISDRLFEKVVYWIQELGVGRLIKSEGALIIRRPRDMRSDYYILQRLAIYELQTKAQKTLLDYFKEQKQ